MMYDDKKMNMVRKVLEKFEECLIELSKLSAKDRAEIYECMFRPESNLPEKVRNLSSCTVIFKKNAFRSFSREDMEISEDGFVVIRRPRVFLSYSHSDKQLARRISKFLEKQKIKVWLDEAELRSGDSLIAKLREAIDSVDILLVLISNNSIDSEWVRREVEIAMNQEINSQRVKVIPVLVDTVELPGFLVGKLYADFRTTASRRKNLLRLADDIRAHMESNLG